MVFGQIRRIIVYMKYIGSTQYNTAQFVFQMKLSKCKIVNEKNYTNHGMYFNFYMLLLWEKQLYFRTICLAFECFIYLKMLIFIERNE